MARATSPLLAAALAALATACAADEPDPAVFSTADASHLRRALGAYTAGDLNSLFILGVEKAGDGHAFCPRTVTTGDVTTVHGDCTTGGLARVEDRKSVV